MISSDSLVSLLLVAYKQEQFVREAVRSAFEQSYSPLEIILSDDCSPDRTFEIMKEEAENYRGPHSIILNRNEKNLGLTGNVNVAWELCRGDFVVGQGGDDISFPHRVETLFKVWREPTPVDCVFSDAVAIDKYGNQTSKSIHGKNRYYVSDCVASALEQETCYVSGCTAGYSRSIMAQYGPLDSKIVAEDLVLPFRALVNRGIRYCEEPLVKYRIHDNNVFAKKSARRNASRHERRKWAINFAAVADDWMRVIDASDGRFDSMREKLVAMKRRLDYHVAAIDAPRYQLPFLALKGICEGLPLKNAMGLLKRNLFHRYKE